MQPLLFSTRPLKCYYDLNNFRGQCKWIINTVLLLSANSVVQISVDVACFVLPWFVLWKLRISTANKGRSRHILHPSSFTFSLMLTAPPHFSEGPHHVQLRNHRHHLLRSTHLRHQPPQHNLSRIPRIPIPIHALVRHRGLCTRHLCFHTGYLRRPL